MNLLSRESKLVGAQRRRLLQMLLIGIATFALPACRKTDTAGMVQGDLFPDFALPSLDGQTIPSSVYRDIPLVVNFWATWCEPCRREMPSLEKLGILFSPKDLLVVGISVDSDRNLAQEFRLHYKLTIPMLSDSDQALSSGILRIPAFPITYLLRRDRTIARIIIGARDWADSGMVDEIEKLLAVRRQ